MAGTAMATFDTPVIGSSVGFSTGTSTGFSTGFSTGSSMEGRSTDGADAA